MSISVLSKENNPLINIITRTNSRPNSFARCRQSIENQTYKKIRHIVCVDRDEDLEYVTQYNCDVFVLNKEVFDKKDDIPDPKTGGRFPYNLYFNYLFSKVEEGWIIILDDDDYLNDNGVIETIVKNAEYETDMILWQMQYLNGIKLPSEYELNKKPLLARIGAPCVAVHSHIAKNIKWDGWKCGDFRYIDKAWNLTAIKRWIRRPLVQIGTTSGGLGRRIDIDKQKPQFKPAYKKTTEPVVRISETEKITTIEKTFKATIVENYRDVTINNKTDEAITKTASTYYDFIIGINTFNRFNNVINLITSIESQPTAYSYKIIVMDDCSSDSKYQNFFTNQSKYVYIRNSMNLKKEKYWQTINTLFSAVKRYAHYKYFIQLDDDFSICPNFLSTVENEFINSNPDTIALSLGLLKEEEGKTRWGHKNFLDGGAVYLKRALEVLNYNILPISPTRFKVNYKISSGVWYQVTQRLLKYNNNSIKNPRYSLVHHDLYYESKMNAYRNEDKKLIHMIKSINFKEDRTPVVMCVWKRIEKLKATLDCLEEQTNKGFTFYIWNNNPEYVEPINKILRNSLYSYPIYAHHSEKNVGGFGRFYYAKELAEQGQSKVIFIDDDQTFGPDLIETFLSEYEPKTIKSRWAWHLKSRYWDRVKVEPNSQLSPHYCGTNGLICDIEVFKDANLFKCPEEYWYIEDLWLSYFARIAHDYTLKASSVIMKCKEDGKGQYHALVPKKDLFFYWLEQEFTKDNYQQFLQK